MKNTININAFLRAPSATAKNTISYSFGPEDEPVRHVVICNGFMGFKLPFRGRMWREIETKAAEGKITLQDNAAIYKTVDEIIRKAGGPEGVSCAQTRIHIERECGAGTMAVFTDARGGVHLVNDRFLTCFKDVFSAHSAGGRAIDPLVITTDSGGEGMINAVIMPVRAARAAENGDLICELDAITEALRALKY